MKSLAFTFQCAQKEKQTLGNKNRLPSGAVINDTQSYLKASKTCRTVLKPGSRLKIYSMFYSSEEPQLCYIVVYVHQ